MVFRKIDLEDELLAEAARRSNYTRSGAGIDLDVIHRWGVVSFLNFLQIKCINISYLNLFIQSDKIQKIFQVDQYLTDLARRFPNLVRVVSGGRTFEGRDIKYLRISSNNFQVDLFYEIDGTLS